MCVWGGGGGGGGGRRKRIEEKTEVFSFPSPFELDQAQSNLLERSIVFDWSKFLLKCFTLQNKAYNRNKTKNITDTNKKKQKHKINTTIAVN